MKSLMTFIAFVLVLICAQPVSAVCPVCGRYYDHTGTEALSAQSDVNNQQAWADSVASNAEAAYSAAIEEKADADEFDSYLEGWHGNDWMNSWSRSQKVSCYNTGVSYISQGNEWWNIGVGHYNVALNYETAGDANMAASDYNHACHNYADAKNYFLTAGGDFNYAAQQYQQADSAFDTAQYYCEGYCSCHSNPNP